MNGYVNEWNNKTVEIMGYPKTEVMDRSLVEVYITEEYRACGSHLTHPSSHSFFLCLYSLVYALVQVLTRHGTE